MSGLGIGLIGAASLLVGIIITELRHWLDRFQRFQVMTFEKRLQAHQEALSQIYRVRRDVFNGKLSYDEKNDSIKNAITWREDNQLLLDKASLRQMQDLFDAAYNHIDQSDPQIAFHRTWEKAHETIYKGIGTKHLPDTTFKEEAETLQAATAQDSKQKPQSSSKPSKRGLEGRLFKSWLMPIWTILVFNLLLFALGLTTTHFNWVVSGNFLKILSPISVMLLILMYIFWYLIPIWPLETGFISLMTMTIIFLLASGTNFDFAAKIRTYISDNFEIDYFSLAMTTAGLAISVMAIYEEQKKRNRK